MTRISLSRTALAALVFAVALPVQAQTVYISVSNGQFGTLNIASGQFTRIGTSTIALQGLGFGSNGTLYGTDGNAEVYTVNTTTGAETDIGNITEDDPYTSTASGSLLYGLDGNSSASFFSYNPNTTAYSQLNAGTGINADGLFASAGSTLYATGYGSDTGNPVLYSLTLTGTVKQVGSTGLSEGFSAGAYSGGTLYGFDSDGSSYTLNTSTGDATLIHSYNVGSGVDIDAAAAAPSAAAAPEPSERAALAFVAIAVGGLLLRARKRAALAASPR